MTWTTLASKTADHCRRFASDQSGASSIEYSILAAGIGGAIITVVATLGADVKTKLYDAIANVF